MSHPRPIVIIGPTAGGKSELAAGLALALRDRRGQPAQILNADSMQVYRHMDAGTAKPDPAQRAAVPHHLLDIVEPTDPFSVADWLSRAQAILAELAQRRVRAIVVGGTNLYLKALLEGLFDGPPADADLRCRLEQQTRAQLHIRLAAVDPAAADRIHPNDRKKMIRAIEVFELTGRPISDWQTQWGQERSQQTGDRSHQSHEDDGPRHQLDAVLLGAHWPVEAINRRINLRVKAMFFPDKARAQDGYTCWPGVSIVDESRQLQAAGLLGPQARLALGYRQVLEHLAGTCTLEEAFEQTKIQTRQFAKRQRTWLKRYRGAHWFDAQAGAETWIDAALRATAG